MSVLITMQTGPVDWNKFKAAIEWARAKQASGHISTRVYRAEGDPSTVLILDEWESHEAFHKYADEVGEEFNKRAGTEGVEWQDSSWVLADTGGR